MNSCLITSHAISFSSHPLTSPFSLSSRRKGHSRLSKVQPSLREFRSRSITRVVDFGSHRPSRRAISGALPEPADSVTKNRERHRGVESPRRGVLRKAERTQESVIANAGNTLRTTAAPGQGLFENNNVHIPTSYCLKFSAVLKRFLAKLISCP